MNFYNHTIAFLIVSVCSILMIILCIISIIISFHKKAKKKEAEFLKTLMEDRERVYQQFALELHDNISNLNATAIAYAYKIKTQKGEFAEATMNELISLLERIYIETHNISRGLSANYITKNGLIPTIEQALTRIKNISDIDTHLIIRGFPKRIPNFKKVMLFRIFQEALMNCTKHAKARKIIVKLHYFENLHFEMVIADNGIGFEQDIQILKPGVGLDSMQERSKQLKGKLQIRSKCNKGTHIQFFAPNFLSHSENKEE